MTRLFLYNIHDPSPFATQLYQRLTDAGYQVIPSFSLNGRSEIHPTYDVLIFVATLSLQSYEAEWQQVIRTTKPIIVVSEHTFDIPSMLRVYNRISFGDDADESFEALQEQIDWVADPVLEDFYTVIHTAVHRPAAPDSIQASIIQPPTTTPIKPPADQFLNIVRRSSVMRRLAAAAAIFITVIVGAFIAVINLPEDKADFIYLTPQATHTATEQPVDTDVPELTSTSTLTLEHTITPADNCCVEPMVSNTHSFHSPTNGSVSPSPSPTATMTQAPISTPYTVTSEVIMTVVSPSPIRPTPRGSPSMDTDKDGIIDIDELEVFDTNVTNPDTDDDGIVDGVEVFIYYTDPLNTDTDGDGFTDGEEIRMYHTDPNDAQSSTNVDD